MWNKRIIWFSLVIIGCSAVAFAQDARYPVDAQKRGAIIGLLVQLSDALSGNDSDLYEAYLAKFDREATPALLSIVLDNKIAFDYRRVALRVIERLSPGDDEIRTLGKYFRERAPVYKDLDESDKETWALIRRYFHQYFVMTKSDEVLQPFREFLEDLKCDLVCQNDATLFLMEHPSVNNVPVLQRVLADPQRDEQVRASAAIGIANAGVEDRLTELVLVANWLLERQEGRGHWFLAIRAIDSLKYLAVTNKSERANSALQELAEGVCEGDAVMKVYLGTDSKRPIEALGQVGGENNLKYLERLSLKRCGNSNANTSAIGVLGYVGNKETIERLKVLAGQYPEQVSVAIKRIEQKIKNEK